MELNLRYDDFLLDQLLDAAEQTARALIRGNKLLIAVEGDNAEEAQELAYKFVELQVIDPPAIRAIALCSDSRYIFPTETDRHDSLFKHQLDAFADPGDIFLGMSVSGQFRNVLAATAECRKRGLLTIGYRAQNAGLPQCACDYTFCMPGVPSCQVHESYLAVHGTFCRLVEQHIVAAQRSIRCGTTHESSKRHLRRASQCEVTAA